MQNEMCICLDFTWISGPGVRKIGGMDPSAGNGASLEHGQETGISARIPLPPPSGAPSPREKALAGSQPLLFDNPAEESLPFAPGASQRGSRRPFVCTHRSLGRVRDRRGEPPPAACMRLLRSGSGWSTGARHTREISVGRIPPVRSFFSRMLGGHPE